ncbi:MAG: tRNA-dihydrouridine synthase family protein [Bacteroidales bacterium]|nr:tRNA-dihydrouridine synthase family protein [Bacteroidales bacterium]
MPEIWLAPLHGLTHYHFRNCLFRHYSGFNAAISPFVPVQETAKLNVRKWKDLAPENNTSVELIPQLMGIIPAHFGDTMNALHQEFGYTRFNWNLGCPMAPIVRKRRGCGLMPFPDEVEAVVAAACRQPYRFSVKMRLGMHSPEEGLEIARRLNQYPLEFVVIHPRLGEQQYAGVPDWNALEELLSVLQHPVIYSGDVFQLADYEILSTRFPQIKTWLLGRGVLRNPRLAEEIQSFASEKDGVSGFNNFCDDKEVLRVGNGEIVRFNEFYEDLKQTLEAYRGANGSLSVLKELWHYFAHFFHFTDEQLHSLLVIPTPDAFDAAAKKLLSSETGKL